MSNQGEWRSRRAYCRIPPGVLGKRAKHTHTLMSLGIAVTAAKVAYQGEDGKEDVAEFMAGDFNWHAQPRTHSLKNVGTTRFEAIEIEWK